MSWRSPAQGGLQSLDTMAQLLRGRANRYAWFGLLVAGLTIVAATLLSCQYEQGDYSWAGLLTTQQSNPALWALDAMPLIFLIWGQYIGSVMSYQAGAMVLDETRELRDEANRLQYELSRQPVAGHAMGLPNRHTLIGAINRSINKPTRKPGNFAVLVLTTEHYHEIAQAHGETAAAQYISQLGERLRSVVDSDDTLAHFGHDDFGIVLAQAQDEAGARHLASRVQLALDVPITMGRSAFSLRASIGIALYPMHGPDAETLLRHAETAKYAAVAARRDYLVYEASLDDARTENSRLIAELHGALYNDGLADEYQPQIPLRDGLPRRLRLLPYWEHPRRGRLAEADFLHLPDRLGLVHGLTTWLLREGLGHLSRWRAGDATDLQLVLRLPDAALRELGFVDLIRRMLQSHDLPGSALVIEFSEAALMQANATQRAQLAALRQSGIQLCLTGVGAPGASAMTSLYYPIDECRLAPGIIDRAAREPLAQDALQKTMELLRLLKLRVVSSAVDSEPQHRLAESLGGDYAEGLSYRAALTPQAVERWLHPRAAV
ncbi:EAL domain-containing protein [Solimonas terrae]|uniref:EAL domain-containing protein n=1 Tax=Solimonas terrae TaxID=1396819 RepID=A0A6M2BW46_9GAMM|nr:EAL domain-containing protein [Solimonas terrae]NGY06177.1 EAL domain-containing protein [Solimonas terrae]